jgi:hypothetical protein
MKMTVQLVVCEDDGREETITDVVILEKTCQQLEQVGSPSQRLKHSYRGCSGIVNLTGLLCTASARRGILVP